MADLVVGQVLWYVQYRISRGDAGHEVTIAKIGRKWAALDKGWPRIDKDTLVADGGKYSSPGRCWLSKDDWERGKIADKAWNQLSGRVRHGLRPNHVTTSDIQAAAALLGIDLSQDSGP